MCSASDAPRAGTDGKILRFNGIADFGDGSALSSLAASMIKGYVRAVIVGSETHTAVIFIQRGLQGDQGSQAARHFCDIADLFGTQDQPLYISDNPVTLHNHDEGDLRGNLGIAVQGIQINLPISSKYSRGLYCTSHKEIIEGLYEKHHVPNGSPIPLEPQNVTHLNALQVAFSTRFVLSSIRDFHLVEEMITENPSFQNGFQPTLA